jgi:flavin-dependent dehydrogenase
MNDYDLLVVGAGFAGLACAREAARLGLRVCVLERQPRWKRLRRSPTCAVPGCSACGPG